MYAAIMKAKGEFRAFLSREGYSVAQVKDIKKAFESLNTNTPVNNETVF